MDAFIQKFCEKYSLPIALSLQLLDNMEKFTFHKGDFLVQEGGRNSNFYIVSKGIWRGHYLNDGVDVSVWFIVAGMHSGSVKQFCCADCAVMVLHSGRKESEIWYNGCWLKRLLHGEITCKGLF